jgi:hypothetical protein
MLGAFAAVVCIERPAEAEQKGAWCIYRDGDSGARDGDSGASGTRISAVWRCACRRQASRFGTPFTAATAGRAGCVPAAEKKAERGAGTFAELTSK